MGSDETLATVTYLPGVIPPASSAHQEESVSSGPARVQPARVQPAQVQPAPVKPAYVQPVQLPTEAHEAAPADRVLRRAENVSMNALTRRGRSRWELGELLASRELEPGVIEAELNRLESVGLIDDSALAETIVRTQHERKGLGRSALAHELRRKHIDPEIIDAALEHIGVNDELRRAVELAEHRVNQLRGLDHTTAVRRLSGYLQRKGYSGDTVRQVILEVLPKRSLGVSFS